MWEDFIHHIYDIFYIVQWLLDSLKTILGIALSPLSWIFNFGRGFFIGVATTPESITFALPASVISLFNAFPYLNLIFMAVGGGLGILFLAFIFKKIIHF
jgi:hypothetical protein